MMTLLVNVLIQRPETTLHPESFAGIVDVAINASALLSWQSPSVSSQPAPKCDRLYPVIGIAPLPDICLTALVCDGVALTPLGNRPPAFRHALKSAKGVNLVVLWYEGLSVV